MVNAQITVTNSRFLDEIGDMSDAKRIGRAYGSGGCMPSLPTGAYARGASGRQSSWRTVSEQPRVGKRFAE
jgi:hypothetical protein